MVDRLKNDDVQEKCNFERNIRFNALEHLYQAFETILLNLPLVECEIQGKYTVAGYNFLLLQRP